MTLLAIATKIRTVKTKQTKNKIMNALKRHLSQKRYQSPVSFGDSIRAEVKNQLNKNRQRETIGAIKHVAPKYLLS